MQDIVDINTGEILGREDRSDNEWEDYIRSANPANMIVERGKRIFEYALDCKNRYQKQGGSHFKEFMLARFGMAQSTASQWVMVGKNSEKLISNANKFAPDWTAFYEFTRLDSDQEQKLLTSIEENGGLIDRKRIKELKKKVRIEDLIAQSEDIESSGTPVFEREYNVISFDPPWPYGREYDPGGSRAANPYPEQSLEEISEMPIPAADDCILWFWTTHQFMRHAFDLLDGFEFEEKMILTWVKDRMGLGRWLRSQSEFCIMAVRGSPVVNLTNQTTILNGPMREHSRKPDEFYDMVEGLCIGARLDYYSREKRPGWDQVGNELEKFL